MSVWDEMYADEAYVYGTEPNAFLAQYAALLAGPVLSVAEGEGRNAVYLATQGLDVLGVDQSETGLAKARRLAAARGVRIRTEAADLASYAPPPATFGSLVSIYAHMPSQIRKRLHHAAESALRPGGIVLLEAYRHEQLGRGTGGPDDPDMFMALADLEREFPHCDILLSREIERDVTEGVFHTGMACVVQFIARKRSEG